MPVTDALFTRIQHDSLDGINDQQRRSESVSLLPQFTAVVQATDNKNGITVPVKKDPQSRNSLSSWEKIIIPGENVNSTGLYEQDIKQQQHLGRQLSIEAEKFLQAGEADLLAVQPRLKLKGWRGWLLGASALIGTGAVAGYLYASHNRGSERWDKSLSNLASQGTVMPAADFELRFYPVSGTRAEKLQLYRSNNTYQAGNAKDYDSNAPLRIEDLREFDRLDKDGNLPVSLCHLKKSGQLDRVFYQRYLYPMILDAKSELEKKALPVNGKNLMSQAAEIISKTILRFEEFNIAHALKIDSFYNQLVLLNREISREEKISNPSARSKQLVNGKWIIDKFKRALSDTDLEDLRYECITLLRYYSTARNYDNDYAMSERQRSIIDKIIASFEQLFSKITNEGVDKYIVDYLAGWMYKLDKEVSKVVKRHDPGPKIFRIFPEIGQKLFKEKRMEFRKPAALLVAYEIFIPRLKELINTSRVYMDWREHRLLEMVLCSFARLEDLLYCGEREGDTGQGKIYAEIPYGKGRGDAGHKFKNIKQDSTLNKDGVDYTKEEIEAYLEKPVPFNGHMGSVIIGGVTGTATGLAAGVSGAAVAFFVEDKSKDIITSGSVNFDSEVRASSLKTSGSERINEDSSLNSNNEKKSKVDSNSRDRQVNKDLDKFPEIPSPVTETRDYMMIWNDAAKEQLKGKDYIVTRGITENISGNVPSYIDQTQKLLQHHFIRVTSMVKKLRQTLAAKAEDASYNHYLKNYFREALSTEDEKILEMAIKRFKQVVNGVDDFLQKTQQQNYNNIFIMSTRRQESGDKGQSASLLTDAELEDVPVALTSYSDKASIAVIADHSELVNPMTGGLCRKTLEFDLTETLTHEATHAAINAADLIYLPRTETGQALSAQDAFKLIRTALTNTVLEEDLRKAINNFCLLNVIKNPLENYRTGDIVSPELANEIMKFLNAYPVFRSYLIMNSAEHLQIFIRDIALAADFNAEA